MEVVNVKNVIIKYIPEHIVVETYVISNSSATTSDALVQQTNTKNKSNHDHSAEPLDEIHYISMDESLNPDSDDENHYEADSSLKEYTEEEYLDVDDDGQELFVESGEDIENIEFVETNEPQPTESNQVLKDWFFDHLNVKLLYVDK